MNHKHNATDLFPTWYKSIDPVVDSTTVTNRITAINTLLEDETTETWFTIIKLAFGIDGADTSTVAAIEAEFKEADINFPLVSNENIIHVLAQISLCFLFESESDVREQVSLAVSNTIFFGQLDKSSVPFYEYAREWLSQPSGSGDDDTDTNHQVMKDGLEAMEESETEVLMDYADQVALLNTVVYLFEKNKKLSQESNILWWLFGQFSSTQSKYFTEVGVDKMILSAAIELAELNGSKNNLPAARHLLHKALVISNNNKGITKMVKLSDVINETPANVKTKILSAVSNISEFTPCLLALSLASQFEDVAVWKGAFKSKISNADIDAKLLPTDIAFQLYNEIMFLSSLQD